MKVVVGKFAGFCGGVTNSVNKSIELLDKYGNMYCLGELVHNKQVVDDLKGKGITFIDDINEVESGSRVIIRAHGVPKEVYELAKINSIELFDLTCPKVLKIHELAESLVKDNNIVVLVAQKEHPEAIGTISFCGNNSIIIETLEDVVNLKEMYKSDKYNKIDVICQTTFSVDKFNKISDEINKISSNVYIHNTICMATCSRQKETKELAGVVDAMIIIGGANSSNTKKLYDIASEINKNTFIIQTVDDINDEDFSNYEIVGVMAGASTPKQSIDDVINYLEAVNK